jgi:hypothetical protein
MKSHTGSSTAFTTYLGRFLPLSVHPRRQLLGWLKREWPQISSATHLYVTNIYDCGEAGMMCPIKLDLNLLTSPVFVVPFDQISINRRHPILREVLRYKRGLVKL